MSDAPPIAGDWFDFELPRHRIAQRPLPGRDGSRLLLCPEGRPLEDRYVRHLPHLLQPGDLLVYNDSRVLPARCRFQRITGGAVEVLFLEPGPGEVEALVRPSRRLREGEKLRAVDAPHVVHLVHREAEGTWRVRSEPEPSEVMADIGEMPLPPYIRRPEERADRDRYQTVFAREPGSAAAPTAGLHFTPELLRTLEQKGVSCRPLTLHVGLATFRPLRNADLERGELHPERYRVPDGLPELIQQRKARGNRVVAVGTTVVRALESATPAGASAPRRGAGISRLFIRPGYRFRVVDGILTNFHLPRTSLLALVAAFMGRTELERAYRHALAGEYRFFSYGDAMLVLRGPDAR